MTRPVRIGLAGLDSSHAMTFTRLVNGTGDTDPVVPGGQVVAAWPGWASEDFAPSRDRLAAITDRVRGELGVALVDSLEELAACVDLILVTVADPRAHPTIFTGLAPAGKPIVLDKILAANTDSARTMITLAERYAVPLLAASSHRFGPGMAAITGAGWNGAYVQGRLPATPPVPAMFWYGAHLVDLLYAVLGAGCRQVTTTGGGPDSDTVVVGTWADGRIGVVRGIPDWPHTWELHLHRDGCTTSVDPCAGTAPRHAGLLGQALAIARGTQVPVSMEELVEVVRFAEAAERSRVTGEAVLL